MPSLPPAASGATLESGAVPTLVSLRLMVSAAIEGHGLPRWFPSRVALSPRDTRQCVEILPVVTDRGRYWLLRGRGQGGGETSRSGWSSPHNKELSSLKCYLC